jgi:O-antigen ligase
MVTDHSMFTIFTKITIDKFLKTGLGLLLFLLPWQTIWIWQERFLNGFKWQYGTLGLYATEILLWISVVLFIVWYHKKYLSHNPEQKSSFSKDRIFIFSILSFVVYGFASVWWSIDSSLALQHALYMMEAFLLFFMLYLGPLKFEEAAMWFLAGATVQSILAIWQFLTQSSFGLDWLGLVVHPAWEAGTSVVTSVEIGRWLRAYGSFSHPNALGGYLVISILVSSILFLRTKNRGVAYRLVVSVPFILQFFALVFTFSRSAWVGAGIVGLFYIYLIRSRINYSYFSILPILVSGILFAIGLVLFGPLLDTRVSHQSTAEIRSMSERIAGYGESVKLFEEQPWFGVGLGNYTAALYQMDSSREGWEYQPVHNVFGLVIVELGVVGAGLLLAVWLLFSYVHLIFFKADFVSVIFFALCFSPLVLFDHYLFSSYAGLLLAAVCFSIFLRIYPNTLHK